jgi:hypothetical protein
VRGRREGASQRAREQDGGDHPQHEPLHTDPFPKTPSIRRTFVGVTTRVNPRLSVPRRA